MGVPLFYSQYNPSPNRSLTLMDLGLLLIWDSSGIRINSLRVLSLPKLKSSLILGLLSLIQVEFPFHCRTLVPYPLISDSDIFGGNLGLAEMTSVQRPRHVAPRLTRRRHLGHVLGLRKYIPTTAPRFYYLGILR